MRLRTSRALYVAAPLVVVVVVFVAAASAWLTRGSQRASVDEKVLATGSQNKDTASGRHTGSASAPAFQAQGNDSTFVQGSNNQIGVLDSGFLDRNGLVLESQAINLSKSGVLFVSAFNDSVRRISRAQILVLERTPQSTLRELAKTDEQTVGQQVRLGGMMHIEGPAPSSIRLCLTYESDQPGRFITVISNRTLVASTHTRKAAREYVENDPLQAFYSSRHADCDRKAAQETIPAEVFSARF
ncbi:hypothetical protein BSFA1_32360 [Burkholderia sp. SFA1]|uniref:hypothetical protein n=1 Tax=unclassified Caballeronia TaxID=2646786 RepID=UPI001F353DEA|nr:MULTISPECIES: hypothetical protein [unclassified Caballeronia]MCE4544845.1 hypothetical protein [Caballeronia sp. PC1]MCE4570269.1 hypothetical protein [Caballeronia sp. CLC5]BBP98107.1 hypothetical protein BSFA1_32360 [Burkholderia sp. SFA1]